jgi:anthranilate/para-aminobenzoate synthase component II
LLSTVNTFFQVGLYHSWAIRNLPETLTLTALSEEKVVMAFESLEQKLFGVQFHPESIMTPEGKKMIQSFIDFK